MSRWRIQSLAVGLKCRGRGSTAEVEMSVAIVLGLGERIGRVGFLPRHLAPPGEDLALRQLWLHR